MEKANNNRGVINNMYADDDISVSSANNLESLAPREKAPKRQQQQLAKTETRLVLCSKSLVVLVLIASAAVLGYLTWRIMSAEETDDFSVQFSYDAQEIITTASAHSESLVSAIGTFSGLFVSSSKALGSPWPNFTLPDFEVFAGDARELSRVELLAFSPLVSLENRPGWEYYTIQNSAAWLQESYQVAGIVPPPPQTIITPFIFKHDDDENGNGNNAVIPEDSSGPYSPMWQLSPPPQQDPPVPIINYNLFSQPAIVQLAKRTSQSTTEPTISNIVDEKTSGNYLLGSATPMLEEPWSIMLQPVHADWTSDDSNLVGHVLAVVPWSTFFQGAVQDSERGIFVVLRESSSGQAYTYRVDGPTVSYVGPGDSHDSKYDNMVKRSALFCSDANSTTTAAPINSTDNSTTQSSDGCLHTYEVYPSEETQKAYSTNRPILFTIAVIAIFFFASFVFFLYDRLVQWRQKKVHDTAIRANAIVFSLFPAKVADQLQRDAAAKEEEEKNTGRRRRGRMNNRGGGGGIDRGMFPDGDDPNDDDDTEVLLDSKPIADLFPSATVLFADIAGFTAWSSIREPSQVFLLLESIYRAFDKIAVHRGIFKVETIGDCYVAVCGLPEPNEEHAVAMGRFARDCKAKMDDLTHKLEAKLGPDTGDLAMRFGLHSGPVTAGVLRGDRARFQLFGDTVNTAARLESTGQRNKIHISQETADLLVVSGKSHWVVARDDKVVAKGKGELTTYWLVPRDEATQSALTSETVDSEQYERLAPGMGEALAQTLPNSAKNQKIQRMIDWNCDILMQLLRLVVAKREASGGSSSRAVGDSSLDQLESNMGEIGGAVTEIHEMIELPGYDSAAYQIDPESVIINDDVAAQLHSYVTVIASMYRDNPFHNFEHASHVSMSTVKLMSRIVAPGQKLKMDEGDFASEELHDHTYGITSDPLTQFSVVLSALIHDVDHRGVPNFVLAQEDARLANVYQNKSVAEQNSIDVAWEVLMDEEFRELRRTIYTSCGELHRFRQLVVNSVMATDIFDKELSSLRKNRWEKAFGMDESHSPASTNRKATIVIEHLIQASDVAHTMQHWHVYTKWNERLYREMYGAYTAGRSNTDPTNGWYEGELRFFDGYVIPLAKKLKECGVFGVSSDEYLNYAEKNRAEWLARGKEVVQSFSSKVARKHSITAQDNNTHTQSSESVSQTSASDINNTKIADIKVTDVRVSDVTVSDMQCKFNESKLGDTDMLDLVKPKASTRASSDNYSITSSSDNSKSVKSKKFDKKKTVPRSSSASLEPIEDSDMNFL